MDQDLELRWYPRDQNSEADAMSNEDFTGCVADLSHSLTAMLFDNHLPWYIASGTAAAFMSVAAAVTFTSEKVPKELANYSRSTAAFNTLLFGFGFGSEMSVMIVMWESALSAAKGLGYIILLFPFGNLTFIFDRPCACW